MIDTVDKISITCSACPKTIAVKPTKKGNPRPPTGWKRIEDRILCQECKNKAYRLRAITFPVASVIGGEWKDFIAALKAAWGRATRLANWSVRQLYFTDQERSAGQTKQSAMPKTYLYGLWQQHYEKAEWQGSASAANAIMHVAEKKYRESRYDLLWLGTDRPPRYTFPMPYPIHNKDWKPGYHEVEGKDGQMHRAPVVQVNIDGKRWLIRLRAGPGFIRQLRSFDAFVSGQAIPGELAIYRKRSNGSHRRTSESKEPGGGQQVKHRIMIKLVGYLPAPEEIAGRNGTMMVRTGRQALLVAVAEEDKKPWLYHADFLRRIIHEYERKRQSISDDLKAEARPASLALRQRMRNMALRQRNRLDTELRRMASMLAKYAARRKMSALQYDDGDKRYFRDLPAPWATLKRYVIEACDREQLQFIDASTEVMKHHESENVDVTG